MKIHTQSNKILKNYTLPRQNLTLNNKVKKWGSICLEQKNLTKVRLLKRNLHEDNFTMVFRDDRCVSKCERRTQNESIGAEEPIRCIGDITSSAYWFFDANFLVSALFHNFELSGHFSTSLLLLLLWKQLGLCIELENHSTFSICPKPIEFSLM